jgi:hypothetical protein
MNTRRRRAQAGSHVAEFGAGLLVLIAIIVLPMLDLIIIPVRWMMAQDLVNAYSRKLALCETPSESLRMMRMEPSLENSLRKIGGVEVNSTDLKMRVTTSEPVGDTLELYLPAQIPDEWLPKGSKGNCVYALQLQANVEIYPAILLRKWGNKIPGVNSAIPVTLSASHQWENLGRDPRNGEYFLNE